MNGDKAAIDGIISFMKGPLSPDTGKNTEKFPNSVLSSLWCQAAGSAYLLYGLPHYLIILIYLYRRDRLVSRLQF